MKPTFRSTIAVGVFALVSGVAVAQSGNDLFQQALMKERTDGNLTEVIALYEKIVQQPGADRKLAAKALYQIGQAYEKLGQAEARKAYERVAREFADQKDVAADASRRLEAMNGGAIASGDNLRRVSLPTTNVTFSPDGRWMTSTMWGAPGRDNGYNELLVQDVTTGETKRLLEGSCGSPCTFSDGAIISPDAKLVVYSWYDDAEINGHGQLRVIANELGATPRVLVRKDELNVDAIAWAPDSRSILVAVRKNAPDSSRQLGWVSVADGTLKIIKLIERHASGGAQISLSPDGRHIAYAVLAASPTNAISTSNDPMETHIYLLAADGTNEVALVKSASVNKSPVWTPDGAHVVFTSNLSGKTDLWSVAVRNGKPEGALTLLKRDIGEVRPIGMTKAGTYYFRQNTTGVEQVHIAELTPGGGSRIVDRYVGLNPTWSPDGKSLAFKRHTARSEEWYHIVVRSLETGQEVMYSRDSLRADPPRWLHNGIGLLTLAGTTPSIGDQWWYRVDLKDCTFSKTVVPRGAFRAGIAAISPDDKFLYTASRDQNGDTRLWDRIIAADLATGQEKEVTRFSGTRPGEIGLTVSPDGRSLAFAVADPQTRETRVFRVTVDGRNRRELYGPYRVNSIDKLKWTKDGRWIFISVAASDSNSKTQIMRMSSEGGTPEFTGLAISNLNTFDISPDGTRIAYSTTARGSRGIFAIDNLPALLNGAK